MSNSRRNFFKAVGVFSFLSGIGSVATSSKVLGGTDKKAPSESKKPSHPAGFPVVVTTTFHFPKDKARLEVGEDRNKWMQNQKKMKEITDRMEKAGELSPVTEYRTYADHHVMVMYFKDQDSFQRYTQLTVDNNVINTELQKKLGYTVVTKIS